MLVHLAHEEIEHLFVHLGGVDVTQESILVDDIAGAFTHMPHLRRDSTFIEYKPFKHRRICQGSLRIRFSEFSF